MKLKTYWNSEIYSATGLMTALGFEGDSQYASGNADHMVFNLLY